MGRPPVNLQAQPQNHVIYPQGAPSPYHQWQSQASPSPRPPVYPHRQDAQGFISPVHVFQPSPQVQPPSNVGQRMAPAQVQVPPTTNQRKTTRQEEPRNCFIALFCPCLSSRRNGNGNGNVRKQPSTVTEAPRGEVMVTRNRDSNREQLAKNSGPLRIAQRVFTYEELVKATNNFSDANLIGEGGFGFVHKGVLRDRRVVAVKMLKAGRQQGEREFQAELDTLNFVHHRNLVSMVGHCQKGDKKILVYDYFENGSLEDHLHDEKTRTLSWSKRMTIAIGAANGLSYLHEGCQPRIIHRDIKAANILLDHKFEAKVADFGLAKLSSDEQTHISTRIMGTFGYLAPEYRNTGKLTYKSDVYSFGILLLELITGKKPGRLNDVKLVNWSKPLLKVALDEGNFSSLIDPKLISHYKPDELRRMAACATACIRDDFQSRPEMNQICNVLKGVQRVEDLSNGQRPTFFNLYGCELVSPTEKWREIVDNDEFSTREYGSTSNTYDSIATLADPR